MSTLKPKFKLKSPTSTEETMILLKIYYDYKRITYSTNRKVLPEHWDDKRMRAKTVRGNQELKIQLNEINSWLNRIESEVERLEVYYRHEGITPTPEIVKRALNEKFKPQSGSVRNEETLNEYIERFINEIENGTRLTDKGTKYQKGTIKNYRGFQTQLDAFQTKMRRKYSFEDITIDLYDDFVRFFNTKKKPYSVNTIGRHIKNLKTIMRASREEGLHENRETERNKFRVLKVQSEQIYLNEEELTKLYRLDLSEHPNLAITRDVFLIGCFTGLRFSDYSRINKNMLEITSTGNKTLHVITQKTGEKVIIPFWHWILEELLEKYDYNVPKTYEQKVNKRIKEVGAKAGLSGPVEMEELKGGIKVKTTVKKYSLIMTHTARRSCATNMYNMGVPSIDIMKITGHKTESNFLNYIRITKEETADRIINLHKVAKPLKKV